MKATDIERNSKQEIKQIFTNWDTAQWKQEIQNKSTRRIYGNHKDTIEEEHVYDNRPSSGIWFRARSNTLQLNDRNIHSNKETNCPNCGPQNIIETIEHFIIDCTTYNSDRQQLIELQHPYNENGDKVIGQFLFSKVNLEKKKEVLFQMWKKRERQLKTLR